MKKQISPFEDWWELVGSKMKNEPGENINDTELPLRIAMAAWEAVEAKAGKSIEHWSSCAVYNEPASPNGECDCNWPNKPKITNCDKEKTSVISVSFDSEDEERIKFAREWAKNVAPKSVKKYVEFEMTTHEDFEI